MNPLAMLIKELRIASGLGMKGLESTSPNNPGVAATYLQKIENEGKVPSDKKLAIIAKGYSKTEDEAKQIYEKLKGLAEQERANLQSRSKRKPAQSQHAGVSRVGSGTSRFAAFREFTSRANKRVVIMGIGMTSLTIYARSFLKTLASRVPIDFLTIDPDILESEPKFAKKLEVFLDYPEFAKNARVAFDILCKFCRDWNKKNKKHKMRFRVYDTIPAMSMVMIDPKNENGEIRLEFFIYTAGEFRLNYTVKKTKHNDEDFALIYEKLNLLWKDSRRIIS